MPDPVTAGIAVGGTVVSSVVSAKGAKDAAATGAASADRAAQLQYEQYLQSRQDLSPYREVAVGEEIYANRDAYNDAYSSWEKKLEDAGYSVDDYNRSGGLFGRSIRKLIDQKIGAPPSPEAFGDIDEVTGYTGGALNTLADWGPSQINVQDYLPGTEVPVYDVNGNIVRWEDNSQIPQYDEVDIYSDPSYQFRLNESLGAVDAAAASMGEVVSGNRLNDIMQRAGDMASQEYQAAYGRNVTDYDIARQAESEKYGRDVFSYGAATDEEAKQYGRDLTKFGYDVDREQSMYNRGLGLYGIDYGQETDYLNRLAALSNIGQTATSQTTTAGQNYASNAGDALIASGQAQAAGQLGQANAIAGGIGDLTSLYAMSQYKPLPQQSFYNNYDSGYYTMGPQMPPNYIP
jgi:hypothetical protein